jgi:cytochrome b subunit of formate dehydrogenase
MKEINTINIPEFSEEAKPLQKEINDKIARQKLITTILTILSIVIIISGIIFFIFKLYKRNSKTT